MSRLTKYSNDIIRNKAVNILRNLDSKNGLNGDELSLISAFCLIERVGNKQLKYYEDLEEQGLLLQLPCKVGDTVYRICPKCNNDHDGTCKNCAWQGAAGMNGCNVYGLRIDGRHHPDECTIVPYKVTWNYIQNLLGNMGKTVFLTREEAETALKKTKEENKNG